MKRFELISAVCSAMLACAACSERVVIGDNGQLPDTDAGADSQMEAEASFADDAIEAHQALITVSLNPKDQHTLVNTQDKYIPILWFDLEGDTLLDRTVTELRFTRSGVGSTSSLQIALCDTDFKCLSGPDFTRAFDTATSQAVFSDLELSVPANSKVRMVLIGFFSGGTVGEHHVVSLAKPTDIKVKEGAVFQGTFPIQGLEFVIVTPHFNQLVYASDITGEMKYPTGSTDIALMSFSAHSLFYTFWIRGWEFELAALDGGKVRGSNGTFLVSNLRIQGDTAQTIPSMELNPANVLPGAELASFSFFDVDAPALCIAAVGPDETKHLELRADLAATEDAPGEFIGHKYQLTLKLPTQGIDVYLQTFADMLNPAAIEPLTSISGPIISIQAP